MSAKVVRRIHLPASRETPAAARAIVRAVVREAQLGDLLDEALLLTTELCTNGVVHAGTEIDLELIAEERGLTVTVTDYRPSLLPLPARNGSRHGHADGNGRPDTRAAPSAAPTATADPGTPVIAETGTPATAGESGLSVQQPDLPPGMPMELAEGGRGLALVDHFASSWGTTHHNGTKTVWFHLARHGTRSLIAGGNPRRAAQPSRNPPSPAALDWLSHVGLTLDEETGAAPAAVAVMRRLCGVLGAAAVRLDLDQADGRGSQPLAGHRDWTPGEGAAEVEASLPVSRPWHGRLVVTCDGEPDPYIRPLAELVAARLALGLEKERLRQTTTHRRSWLIYLAEAGELLAQSLDVELTLALIPRLVVPRLGHWCAVHQVDEWGDPRLAAATHADEDALPHLLSELARTGPDSARTRIRAALRNGNRTALAGSVEGYTLPLVARGQRLGTLSIGRLGDHWMDPDEVAMAEDLARRCALALDNARIHADRNYVARTLQEALLPPPLPAVGGLAFAAQYVPSGSGLEVGGDFYDVLPMTGERWLLVIGDVSGKGVHAATLTGLVRNVIRVLVRDGKPMPEMLSRLNEILLDGDTGRYCTLALATVGPGAGRRKVRLHLAGHDSPVLVRSGGATRLVGQSGTALGLLDDVVFPATDVTLDPGDALIFYTDGITERRRGPELFGQHRLQAAAADLADLPADVIATRLRNIAMDFSSEPPRDDLAILALRNEPAHPPLTR